MTTYNTPHFQRFPWLASQEVWRSAHQQAVRHRVGPTFAWPKPTWLFSVGSFEGKSLWKQSPNSPGTENINRQANPKNHQRTDQKRDWPLRQTRQNLPPEGRGSFGACSLSCSKTMKKSTQWLEILCKHHAKLEFNVEKKTAIVYVVFSPFYYCLNRSKTFLTTRYVWKSVVRLDKYATNVCFDFFQKCKCFCSFFIKWHLFSKVSFWLIL